MLKRCAAGHPLVLRCHPLRTDGLRSEPFPTLYWLACENIHRMLSALESAGAIEQLETRLRDDSVLAARFSADHDSYVSERWSRLSPRECALVESSNFAQVLRERGIGGTQSRANVKCLHLHYAHHLARGSVVGELIEEIAGGPLICRLR